MKLKDQAARDIAVSDFSGNFLVSAGAGCGKTQVLTTRIYNIIKKYHQQNPHILSELLVLTFTNKAAGEMKGRTRSAVLKDPELAYLAGDVESSDMTTFDAFALSIVKRYHHSLNIRGEVSIGDEIIFRVKLYNFVQEIFEKKYQEALINPDSDFGNLIRKYCIDKDDKLILLVCDILDFCNKKVEGTDWLKTCGNKLRNDSLVDEILNNIFLSFKEQYPSFYNYVALYNEDKYYQRDKAFLDGMASLKSFDDLFDYLKNNKLGKNSSKDPDTKAAKGEFNNKIKAFYRFLNYGNSKEIKEGIKNDSKLVDVLIEISLEANEKLKEYKDAYSMYSFSDIFTFAYKLIETNEEIREELKNRYKFILIDEYQDTNDIQESLISLISNNNVFQVGDIKQSIYGFRGANCDLFNEKYAKYSKNQGGRLLTLSENFRTRESVINSVNEVFSSIMTPEFSGLDYKNGHALGHGQVLFDASEHLENYNTQLYTYAPKIGESTSLSEAAIIANDIISKIKAGYQVYEKDVGLRPCKYKDFAILMNVSTAFKEYQKIFNLYGIPLDCPDQSAFEERDATVVLLNICRLVNILGGLRDSKKEKLLFMSIARSFLVCWNDEDLYQVIKDKKYEEVLFFNDLKEKAYSLRTMNLKDALLWIIEYFNVYENLTILGDIKTNYERIQDMLSSAEQGAKLTWNLNDFVQFYDDLKEFGLERDIISSPRDGESVKLMTMHASKGLEFPILYLPRLSSKSRSNSNKFLISNEFGIVLPNFSQKNYSIFHELNKGKGTQEGGFEKIRLFYVACTRARDKLILISPEGKCERSENPKNFIDYFMESPFSETCQLSVKIPDVISQELVDSNEDEISFKEVTIPQAIIKDPFRASKALTDNVDPEVLRLGTKLHRILELIDFKTKDLSWLEPKERPFFERILSLDLLKDAGSAEIFHEYAFEDEDTKLNGIIDLLLVYKDHIDIVDYKTSHIDDPAYEAQLKVYEDYISKHFNLPIKKYLLSLKECRVKEV